MSEPNSKLFKDDPATYYTELGAQAERERIIKLLEDSCSCVEECYCTLNKAYDLIKGEQK